MCGGGEVLGGVGVGLMLIGVSISSFSWDGMGG